MANFDNLKATIRANIRTNGNEEITGSILQSTLLDMVDDLGENVSILSCIIVEEDGLYFVDANYYIGAYLDQLGLHAQNIPENPLEYEIV